MPKRTKVFVLIKGLGLGGAEKLLELAIPHIDRNRFEYEVGYLLPWKNALAPAFEKAGIPTFCLHHRGFFDFGVLARLARLLRQRSIDVLHLHLPYTGVVGRIASRLTPVKAVIYTEHNLLQRYHWLTGVTNRLTYGWNDAVIAVSAEVERSIRSHIRLNGRSILRTIPNGVDLEELANTPRQPAAVRNEFDIPSHHQLVVHVGSFTPKKRHVDLLSAARRVLQEYSSVTFLLIGQGPLEADIKQRALELGIADSVAFAGFRSDAARLIAGSDIFVLSSKYEGLPVSLLEAMAMGKPLVATRVGGIPEVVRDGVEGLLVEPMEPQRLANQLLTLLNNPALRRRLGTNARNQVRENFHVKKMVERVEMLYHETLAGKDDHS